MSQRMVQRFLRARCPAWPFRVDRVPFDCESNARSDLTICRTTSAKISVTCPSDAYFDQRVVFTKVRGQRQKRTRSARDAR